jgi:hypothetical protein
MVVEVREVVGFKAEVSTVYSQAVSNNKTSKTKAGSRDYVRGDASGVSRLAFGVCRWSRASEPRHVPCSSNQGRCCDSAEEHDSCLSRLWICKTGDWSLMQLLQSWRRSFESWSVAGAR